MQSKTKTDAARIAADLKKAALRADVERERIASSELVKGIEIGAETAIEDRKLTIDSDKNEARDILDGVKLGYEMTKGEKGGE